MTDEFDWITIDWITTPSGGTVKGPRVLRVHGAGTCALDEACCLHNPSDHAMREWPLHWRMDRGIMERMCAHGIGHPDPDSVAYGRRALGLKGLGTHGCDGCCRG